MENTQTANQDKVLTKATKDIYTRINQLHDVCEALREGANRLGTESNDEGIGLDEDKIPPLTHQDHLNEIIDQLDLLVRKYERIAKHINEYV